MFFNNFLLLFIWFTILLIETKTKTKNKMAKDKKNYFESILKSKIK